jgi:Double zinc ribbon
VPDSLPRVWFPAISWPGGSWQDTVKIVGAVVITYVVVLWAAGLIWVYRDIRDRTRDPFYQAISVFVVLAFNLPGLWLYLILRPKLTLAEAYERTLEEEALLQELEDQKGCPTCHRRVLDDYIVCPSCTTQLKEPCPRCAKPLSYSWVACPYCANLRRPRGRTDFGDEPTTALRRTTPAATVAQRSTRPAAPATHPTPARPEAAAERSSELSAAP